MRTVSGILELPVVRQFTLDSINSAQNAEAVRQQETDPVSSIT
ncbi:hypothetical protein [Arthrobacter sp. fls2-241-R2A-200]|nr:hypothetical protein [Arthrobacter sp. fls2-241-R2A-200]